MYWWRHASSCRRCVWVNDDGNMCVVYVRFGNTPSCIGGGTQAHAGGVYGSMMMEICVLFM